LAAGELEIYHHDGSTARNIFKYEKNTLKIKLLPQYFLHILYKQRFFHDILFGGEDN
jgi:hypothetical protein